MTSPLLNGKSVLVTGAARGLGAAIAETCLRHGATVILTDVLAEELDATVAALGPHATAHPLDVADPDSWQRLIHTLRGGVGRPDVLVNNAGVVRGTTLLEAAYADLQLSFDVNVGGTFLGMKAYLELHMESGAGRPGSIVNISSVRGLIGGARSVTYSASKFAVRGLTKAAAVELGPLGIRVNCISAGPIATLSARGIGGFTHMVGKAAEKAPLKRNVTLEDIGKSAYYLLSDLSSGVTGETIYVDCGYNIVGV